MGNSAVFSTIDEQEAHIKWKFWVKPWHVTNIDVHRVHKNVGRIILVFLDYKFLGGQI